MTNPARDLYDIFLDWSVPNQTAYDSRGFPEDYDRALNKQLEAVRLLLECREILNQLEQDGMPMPVYRRNLPKWSAAVLNFPHSWTTGPSTQAFDELTMATLDAFALHIEGRHSVLTPGYADSLDELLSQIEALLQDDASLSPHVRAHVYEVIKMLQRYLSDAQMYGDADIAQALYALWVALGCAAGDADEETRDRWRGFRDDILKPAVAGLIAAAPSNLLAIMS